MHGIARRTLAVVLAVVLAVALVTAGMPLTGGPSPVGTAKAQSSQCSYGELFYVGISPVKDAQAAATDLACEMFTGETGTENIDHNQTKTELVQRAATNTEHAEITLDSFNNSLQNTKAVARLEGQAAYYRALENGSSESAARTQAKQAVRDYFSVKQHQLVQTWNVWATAWVSYDQVETEEGLASDYIAWVQDTTPNYNISSPGNQTTQTVNDTTIEAVELTINGNTHLPWTYYTGHEDWKPAAAYFDDSFTSVRGPGAADYTARWNALETQSATVVSEMDTYINNTYSEYQAGEVNATQLVDANTLTREFSPSDDGIQSWTSLMLALSEDVDAPQGLDGLGNFTVAYQGTNHTGLLLADSQEMDTIETGQTYDGTNFSVTPKVVESSGDVTDLDGEFTVHEITDSSGATVGNVTYREVEYTTTNTTEYQQLMDEMDAMRAELEAREENLQGGFAFPDLGGGGSLAALLGLVAVVLIVGQARRD